jgi:hypothetical protein
MATACVAFPVADIQDVAYHQQRTQLPLRTGLDDILHRVHEEAAGICTKTTKRCDSANNGYCPSTPTSRVCIHLLDSSQASIFCPSLRSWPAPLSRSKQALASSKRWNLTFSSQLNSPLRPIAKLSRWSQNFFYLFLAFLVHMKTTRYQRTAMPRCHNYSRSQTAWHMLASS